MIVLSAMRLPLDLLLPSLDFLFFFISSSMSLSGDRNTFDFCLTAIGVLSSFSDFSLSSSSNSSRFLFNKHRELDKLASIAMLTDKSVEEVKSGRGGLTV